MFYGKKTVSGVNVNEEPAEELHKPVIKQFKRRRVYVKFKDNICAADSVEMGSFSSKNRNAKYLLCVIKKGKTVLNAFIKTVNKSNRKPSKLWVDQGREFYNKYVREWLDKNDILMYSTHNEGKSVISERFIKILKAKIYKKWKLIMLILNLPI